MHGLNATTGQAIEARAHLQQSIRDILTTPIGSRVMRRDYGSRLPDFLDQPMTPRLAVELYAATAEALQRWEPRIRLTRVRIEAATPRRIVLGLEAQLRADGQWLTLAPLEVTR